LEETETSLLFAPDMMGLDQDLPQAASEIMRRMQLAELILKFAEALPHAIVSVDARGAVNFDTSHLFAVAHSNADAWHLAGELANLIDELILEGIDWKELDLLVLPEFDAYWRITLKFLNIAISHWPSILADRGLVDKARRQITLIEKQTLLWENSTHMGPVIAIGSTGSNRATAKLLSAIAKAPQGAVVLPGLDQDVDSRAWAEIGNEGASHPQSMLARLLPSLEIQREEVVSLGHLEPALKARKRFVAEALRPANTTEDWALYQAEVDPAELGLALEHIALIEASDEREEALCLAIAMREALETQGQTAALVTPSRELALRVRAELRRWSIDVDDSGGDPLSTSPSGILAQLVINTAIHDLAAADCAALLQHPLVTLGFPREELTALAQGLEIGLLRTKFAAQWLNDPHAAIVLAKADASDHFAHPARRRMREDEWARIADLLHRLAEAFKGLSSLDHTHGLTDWIQQHRTTLLALTSEDLIKGEAFEAIETLFDELALEARPSMKFSGEDYAVFFAEVIREITLRGPKRAHPRLKILGLIEARLMDADVMLLGGLDETIWPPSAHSDAFLNRPMRTALGLSPPERRLGQTAHDFAQAMGCKKVILSRAAKRNGTPTVASRLVQRLAALGGEAWQNCRIRGAFYSELSRAIDQPLTLVSPLKRPRPKPPLELRPQRLSVTRIETLRRDPYAIYAELILGLKPLDPLGAHPTLSEIGSAYHNVLEQFVRAHPNGPLPPDAKEEIGALLKTALDQQMADPEFMAFQWPRLALGLNFYLGFEARRREAIANIHVEIEGELKIPLADGAFFTLSAKADRIEKNRDGSLSLIDYKTGTPPGNEEVVAGFAPQLTLEAAMAKQGAFGPDLKGQVAEGLYLKLGGAAGGNERKIEAKSEGLSFALLADLHYLELIKLLNQFRDPETFYASKPFPKFVARFSPYDHLARVKEWSQSGGDEGVA
jgi:ATP-dependent helicase/nuclease subunit B